MNTDRITALQRTRIRFAGHDVGADDDDPAVGIDIRGKSAAGKRVLLSDLVRLHGAPPEYRLPPGSYSVAPSPEALRKWPTAMCFERTEFEVADGAEGEVVVLLDRPLSLVKLTVVDDDGRPIRGHTIFTKGDGARTTSHSEILLAFDDEVADLKVLTGDMYGLEDVELKQVALKRGQTTPIRVQLRRMEVR